MTNEQLVNILKATIDTTASAGIASPEDPKEFIDLAVDQTPVLGAIRTETDIRKSRNIDTLLLSEPAMIAGVEGTAPAAADVIAPTRNRNVLTPTEKIVAFDVSFDFLHRNIEGENVNKTLNSLFAKRFGKDLVLAAFRGDTAGATTTRTEKALATMDGFTKLALADSNVNDYTIPAAPSYRDVVFPEMLRLLPKDYRDDRAALGFFVSIDVLDTYADELGARETAAGDMVISGPWSGNFTFKGVPIYPVFGLPDDTIILTIRENLCIGFGREMRVGKDIDNRARLLKVTMVIDADVNYALGEAIVLGQAA